MKQQLALCLVASAKQSFSYVGLNCDRDTEEQYFSISQSQTAHCHALIL